MQNREFGGLLAKKGSCAGERERERSRRLKKKKRRVSGERSMDPKLTVVAQTFERFKAAFIRNDFDTSTRLLSQLKVLVFSMS